MLILGAVNGMHLDAIVRRPLSVLAASALLLGGCALVTSWHFAPAEFSLPLALILFVVLVLENFAVHSSSGYSVSLAYPLAMTAAILCGPTESMLVAAVSMINVADFRRRLPLSMYAFNLGQQLVSMALSGWSYVLLGGKVLLWERQAGIVSSDFPRIILPLLAAAVLGVIANVVLAGLGHAVRHGKNAIEVWRSMQWAIPAQLTMALVGFLIAQVTAISAAALPLFVFPLLVARDIYGRYNAMADSYTDTIRSMVAALEAKDTYTRGHSERVACYAVMLAKAVGLGSRAVQELEHAALLHDLGKLTVPGEILRKPTALDSGEWLIVRQHPQRGADMLERVPALRRYARAVAEHHERVDGEGYPSGIHSDALGVQARILAIADAYDAMTSDRSYRKGLSSAAALDELRKCAGSHFDEGLVEAFVLEMLNAGTLELEQDCHALAAHAGVGSR